MQSLKLQLVLAIIVVTSASAFGQTQPNLENGYKAYGSYDGSNIDTINTMNGNLMLHLPMPFSYPQRGGKMNPLNVLTISSKNWSVQCSGLTNCYWTLGRGGVGALVAEAGNGVGFDHSMDLSVHRTAVKVADSFGVTYGTGAYSLSTADGASHKFFPSPNAILDQNGDPLSYDAGDLSGYHLELSMADSVNFPGGGVLSDRHGDRYQISFFGPCNKPVTDNNLAGSTTTVTCTQASRTSTITDVNGNVLTLSSGTGVADTMGRPFIGFTGTTATSDFTGCVSNRWPLTSATMNNYAGFNYTGSNRVNQFKLCYANVTIQTAFGVTLSLGPDGSLVPVTEGQNGPNVPHPWIVPMLVTVVMPDGTSWKIDYDSYGNVTHLGLPLGGSIDYGWTTAAPPSCRDNTTVSRAVATRTINDNNGHSFTWKYNYGAFANGVMTNTVTDPLQNDTDHVFTALFAPCGSIYETSTADYQGTGSSRQLVKQLDTGYQTSLAGETFSIFANSYRTTIFPSGKVKLVQRTKDPGLGNPKLPTYGLVTQQLEYDWGQGAPGPLLRETDTVYQWQKDSRYLTANLLDLPASVVVVDPNSANNTKTNCPVDAAGTTKSCAAETDYTYDEVGYLQSYEGMNGALPVGTHVPAPNVVRGNLTSTSRWLNTIGAMVVSHTNWFDTGMVYQTIDPLNHASTQSYDLFYAGVYPTKTCDALNHCVSGTYDFTTGLLTSFTNQNASTTAISNTPGDAAYTASYGYDTLSRITSATFPDGGRVSFNYSAPGVLPVYMEKLTKITAALPDDDSFAYLDGLGRPFKGVHKTPTGDVTVMKTFDALNQVINVTNPYISTSDPTYGEVQTQYDVLGRTTQVTKQDGSFTMAVYNQSGPASTGDCATTTDEAGKARRTCSDGLGRLVEVDEPGDNFGGTRASGGLNINGSLLTQTIPGTNATNSTGTITIQGSEHSINKITVIKCTLFQIQMGCENTTTSSTVYDTGKVTIAINGGTPYQSVFGAGSSSTAIAGDLRDKINNPNSPNPYVSAAVTSTSSTSATITLTAKTVGNAGNSISFTTAATWDTTNFPPPTYTSSFVPSPASGTLSGGTNGTAASTVTDSGTTKATIRNQAGAIVFTTADVPYGGASANTDASKVTAALITALNASGSPLTASPNGSSGITVLFNTLGTAGNVSIAVTSTSSQPTYFPNGSFSGATTLSNGTNPQAPSLDHPFVTLYAYDALGNLTCVVQKGMDTSPFTTCPEAPAVWRPRSFTYDSMSRLVSATNPEAGTITYSYDNAGNILQKTSPAANQTGAATTTLSFCYDELNRVTGKAYSAQTCQNGRLPAGTAVVSYTYDVGPNAISHLSSLMDQAGSAAYSYDALGRMTTELRTITGVIKSVSYDYNLDGSLKVIHYPSGAAVTYAVDAAGRTVSVNDSLNGINYITGATYAPDNSITGFVNGPSGTFAGITNTFSYNQRLQPVNISAVTPSQQKVFAIGYDFHVGNGTTGSDNGNVWGVTNVKDPSRGRTFNYDALNRLTSAQTSGTDCGALLADGHTKNWGNSYSYDPWGNLLSNTPTKCGAENVSFTMNAKNQPTAYTYDAAGNLINDGVLTYNYDAENRITGANGYTYTYDAAGNRVRKSNGTTGTLYWYASVGVIAETDLAGNNPKEYVFFNGTRVARKDANGQVFYYFSDHLKTATVITDANGNIKSESDYDPWGIERRVVDNFVNTSANTYKFTGKERDNETGLDYFGARYYSSAMGRFMTPDWAAKAVAVPYANYGNPQSLNLYSYVQNNPTTLGDPDGHQTNSDHKNVASPKSGAPKKDTDKVKKRPMINVGIPGNPIWQPAPSEWDIGTAKGRKRSEGEVVKMLKKEPIIKALIDGDDARHGQVDICKGISGCHLSQVTGPGPGFSLVSVNDPLVGPDGVPFDSVTKNWVFNFQGDLVGATTISSDGQVRALGPDEGLGSFANEFGLEAAFEFITTAPNSPAWIPKIADNLQKFQDDMKKGIQDAIDRFNQKY